MQAGSGPLDEAQRQAGEAAATLIERKFKEPSNLEVKPWRIDSWTLDVVLMFRYIPPNRHF